MSTRPIPKRTIGDIQPYKPGKAKAAGYATPLKLSANENPLGCSPRAVAAYQDAASSLHLYPDPRATVLRDALAEKYGLDPARLIFGTGSDEVFSIACQAYLSPGENMVQPQYAFAAWAIAARASGADVKSAPEKDFTVDVDAMLAAVDVNTRVMFIANPANPTGTQIPFSEVVRLHEGLPRNVLLVLDGAYAEYGDDGGVSDWEQFGDAPNVLITRTFSKLHGLASLRVGWGYASAEIIDAMSRIRLPFNLSTPAIATALAALEDTDFVTRSVALAKEARGALSRLFEGVGWRVVPSAANFVTVQIPANSPLTAPQIEQAFTERGILVRGLGNYGMPDCLRVSIGTEEQLARLSAALDAIVS